MKNHLSFEFYKRWRSYRNGLIGALALQIILIPLMSIFNFNKLDNPLAVTGIIYFFSLAAILIIPPVDSVVRFDRDISGSVSVLELSLPLPAWKKVLSKLIVTICTLLAAVLLCAWSVLLLARIITGSAFRLYYQKAVAVLFANPSDVAELLLITLLSLLLIICIIYFCIALSHSITHKNKVAPLISITAFIACMIGYSLLSWFSTLWPIVTFNMYASTQPLSLIFFQIALIALSFCGTSWLVERKIES